MTWRARMSIARSQPRQQGHCQRYGENHSQLQCCHDTEYTCRALHNMRTVKPVKATNRIRRPPVVKDHWSQDQWMLFSPGNIVVNHQFSIGKGLRAYGIVFVEMLYFDSAVPLMLLHGIRYMRCVLYTLLCPVLYAYVLHVRCFCML